MILRNVLEDESRRRTIEILKFRGTDHQKGEYPFTIVPDGGVVVIPLSAMQLKQKSSDVRISSGNAELDEMCGGGFFRDSVILVSGRDRARARRSRSRSSSTAARSTASAACCSRSRRAASSSSATRRGWGVDFEQMERDGLLRVVCDYPEVAGARGLAARRSRRSIEEFKPHRVALDSLSALERVGTHQGVPRVRHRPDVVHQAPGDHRAVHVDDRDRSWAATSITEAHISTLTDSIILLRYVEMFGEMKRGLTVLKMRGSAHDKGIREFTIDKERHAPRPAVPERHGHSRRHAGASVAQRRRAGRGRKADEEGLRRRAAAADGGVIQRRQSDRREELA